MFKKLFERFFGAKEVHAETMPTETPSPVTPVDSRRYRLELRKNGTDDLVKYLCTCEGFDFMLSVKDGMYSDFATTRALNLCDQGNYIDWSRIY